MAKDVYTPDNLSEAQLNNLKIGAYEAGKATRITKENAAEYARRGTAQRKKNAQRRRKMREAMATLLNSPLTDIDQQAAELLAELGIDDPLQVDAIALAMTIKAKSGDVEAAKFTRDTSGEKPVTGVEVGNLDGKPFESIDLSTLSDEQLQQMAAERQLDE